MPFHLERIRKPLLRHHHRKKVNEVFETLYRFVAQNAEQGNPNAQLGLGEMFRKGQGVPQNYAEAVKWYRMAAEQGNAKAQNRLAFLYDKRRGISQNYGEVVSYGCRAGRYSCQEKSRNYV